MECGTPLRLSSNAAHCPAPLPLRSCMQVTAYGIISQNCQTGALTSNVQFFPSGSDGEKDDVSPYASHTSKHFQAGCSFASGSLHRSWQL